MELRPHEIFTCEISQDLTCQVLQGKTGDRLCYPLNPQWASDWRLWEIKSPQCTGATYRDLGKRVTVAFWRRDVPFVAYDLRHAYAIRGSVKYKVPVAAMAAWMGHSPVVHWNTYNKWISQDEHAKVFEELKNQIKNQINKN